MSRKKAPTADTIDKLVQEVGVPDMLILTAGFFAGTQGWTPMTALINMGRVDTSETKKKLTELQQQGNTTAGFINGYNPTMSPLDAFIPPPFRLLLGIGGSGQAFTSGIFNGPPSSDEVGAAVEAAGSKKKWKEYTPDEQKQIIDGIKATIALGCIGMIEAWAITRPGTLQGIGSMIQGIGEIVPL